jgi:hypothetical protein
MSPATAENFNRTKLFYVYKFWHFKITHGRDLILQKRNLKKTAMVMDATCYQNVVVIDCTMVLVANTRMSVLIITIVETKGYALILKLLQPLGSSVIVNWGGMDQSAQSVS